MESRCPSCEYEGTEKFKLPLNINRWGEVIAREFHYCRNCDTVYRPDYEFYPPGEIFNVPLQVNSWGENLSLRFSYNDSGILCLDESNRNFPEGVYEVPTKVIPRWMEPFEAVRLYFYNGKILYTGKIEYPLMQPKPIFEEKKIEIPIPVLAEILYQDPSIQPTV